MLTIFLGYLVLTLGLGLWQATRTKSQSDFVLGGSMLPGWMLALSERATGESAWLLLGLTGFIYANGFSGMWIGLGCLLGISTAWIVLARKFREEAKKYNALTMPEYFSQKFIKKASTIRFISTLIIVFFFVFYVGAQFAGAGKTIFETFGMDPKLGGFIAAAVILAYATIGGFVSVVAVDTFQSILMITTLVVTPIIMVIKILTTKIDISQAFAAASPGFTSLTGTATGFAAGLLIFNNIAWYFGYLGGQPQLNARFMGMRDERNVKIGRNVAVTWTFLAYIGAFIIGTGAVVLYGPSVVPDSEMILPYVLNNLFPWWLAAILLAGAVAAMVSTAESMLLVAASSVSEDIYKGIIKKGDVEDKKVLLVSRIATLSVGIFALILSMTTSKLIYTIVSYAWAGIGCSFAPAILLSFYWDKFNSNGVITSLVAGLVTTVIWIITGLEKTITARAVTFFVAITLAIVVSLLTQDKKKENYSNQ